MIKDRLSAILATGATGANWLVDCHEALSILVTVLTLAWWIRLWWKNPNIEPPKLPAKKTDEKAI